ncbi:MAG: hypothetical protein ACREP9_18395 [Candidatus Dormibacteraceae bacterium]
MINHLYIAAKAPRPGVCKTRLGQMIGDSAAASLYAAFLADLGARLQSQHYLLGWYVAPSTAWPAIAPLVPPPDSILVQPDGEWG